MVRLLTDRVAVMYLGKLVETGPSEALFRTPAHHCTKALVWSIPGQGPRIRLSCEVASPIDPSPQACRFHGRCPGGEDQCLRLAPPVVQLPGERTVAWHLAARSRHAFCPTVPQPDRTRTGESDRSGLRFAEGRTARLPLGAARPLVRRRAGAMAGRSRRPVREALSRLRNERLLTVASKSGWYVLPIEFTRVDQLYDLR